jgi:hypothetical protein
VKIQTVGLKAFGEFTDGLNEKANKAASMSINDSARYGHKLLKNDIMRRINVPSSYIGSTTSGRMSITQYAKPGHKIAEITARRRGTSLNRFLLRGAVKGSVRVSVRPGSVSKIDKAFVMRLRNGNKGIAQRVAGNPDKHPKSNGAVKIGKGLFLLYGPSISQVMNTVVTEEKYIQKDIGNHLEQEFNRQFNRLTRGR